MAWSAKPGFQRSIFDYVGNRLLLPGILLHLELLRGQAACGPFVASIEVYLAPLTTYQAQTDAASASTQCRTVFDTGFQAVEFLQSLDSNLQRVVREAGPMLR